MRNTILTFVILIFFWTPTFSQDKREDMDSILKKELGLDAEKNSTQDPKNKSTKDPTNNPNKNQDGNPNPSDRDPEDKNNLQDRNSAEERNPVQDRYLVEEDSSSTVWMLLKVILVFGGLTFVMIYILKVMARTRNSRFPVQGEMSILSSLPVGANKQLQMVEVSGKVLVIGVGDQSINLITEITSFEDKDRIFKQKEEFMPTHENFLVTMMETLKDFRPNLKSDEYSDSQGSLESNGSKNRFSNEDPDLEELERQHKLTLERLKADNKKFGLDSGGAL